MRGSPNFRAYLHCRLHNFTVCQGKSCFCSFINLADTRICINCSWSQSLPLNVNVSNHSLRPIMWQSHFQGLLIRCSTCRLPRESRWVRSNLVRRLYCNDKWVRWWKLSASAPGSPPMLLWDRSKWVRLRIDPNKRRSTSRIELLARMRVFKLLSPSRALGETIVMLLLARSRTWRYGVSRKAMEPMPRIWLSWRCSSRVSGWSLCGMSYKLRPLQSTTLAWLSHQHSLGQEETAWISNRVDSIRNKPPKG